MTEPSAAGAGSPTLTRPAAGLRLKVLVNAGGGTVRREGADATRQRLQAAFADHGAAAELALVPGGELRDALRAALEEARAGRLDGVVVGGGDGSVSTAAGVLAGSEVPLGVLPLGTLNHFAKDIGMPTDLDEAVAAIGRGHVRPVDVGEVNGEVFVNNSLLGIYPYMVTERERRRERHGIGKWPAMGLAFLRMLWRFPRRRVAITVEGATKPYRTPLLFVGVNEYSLERMKMRRARGMSGGELWLFVAKHRDPLAFLWFAARTQFGGLRQEGDFEMLRVTSAEVTLRASRVPVSRDGEVERMRGPLAYKVRPGALKVFAPVEAEA